MKCSFLDIYEEDKIEYIVLIVDDQTLESLELEPILESYWKPAAKKGWSLRVDAENPQMKLQKHVHITKTKQIDAKSNQFSWNQDGTRHDNHSFSRSENGLKLAKTIARDALGLGLTAVFESANTASKLLFLCEEVNGNLDKVPENTIYLKIKDC